MIPALVGNRVFILLLVLAGVVVAATNGAITLSALESVPAETEETYKGWTGAVHLQGGIDGRGEKFITAGEDSGRSQAITAVGKTKGAVLSALSFKQYHYRVYINGEERTALRSPEFPEVKALVGANSWIPLQPYTFSFTGTVTGSLKVEMWARIGTFAPEYHRVGYDGAALASGAGTVKVKDGTSDRVQEGKTLLLDVRTGEGLWTLQVFNGKGEATCGVAAGGFETISGSTTGGSGCKSSLKWGSDDGSQSGKRSVTVGFVVPIGAFDSTGKNTWKFILHNSLIDHSAVTAFVVDKAELSPEVPKVSVSPLVPRVGESFTLTMTSRANPTTNAPVQRFELRVWYGSLPIEPALTSPNWIARDISVPATNAGGTYTAQYTIQVTTPDIIQYRVTAYDTAGRPSGAFLGSADCKEARANLSDANCNGGGVVKPEGSGRNVGPQYPPGANESGVLVLVAVIALIVGVIVWFLLPAPFPVKIGILVALGLGVGAWALPRLGGAA